MATGLAHRLGAAVEGLTPGYFALVMASGIISVGLQLEGFRVFSLILYLSLVGLALFGAVAWIQRRFVFWHRDRVITGEA